MKNRLVIPDARPQRTGPPHQPAHMVLARWRIAAILATLSALALAGISYGLGGLHSFRISSGASGPLILPKMLAESLAAYLAALGVLASLVGLGVFLILLFRGSATRMTGAGMALALLTMLAGARGASLSAGYLRRVTAPHDGFTRVFGADWQTKIPPTLAPHLLKKRWTWRAPEAPEPRWTRDLAFWTIPETGRRLLCDLWQPPEDVPPSGLAFIYLHGAGWHLGDKDLGTRFFFRHLTAQGHVVMDVAYRLCPETDLRGMVGDAKRAVVWMRRLAGDFGVDPERIVIGGGSSGGHLALLAAYAPGSPAWSPQDLKGTDASVRAVISYYGPTDLNVYYEHAGAIYGLDQRDDEEGHPLAALLNNLAAAGVKKSDPRADPKTHFTQHEMMVNLLGGGPHEVPAMYELGSPIGHAGAGSPPTLLLYGGHDSTTSAEAARSLHRKLAEKGVPAIYLEFPQTEHAFDIILPRFSPAAQAALYDTDRFLALMAGSAPPR